VTSDHDGPDDGNAGPGIWDLVGLGAFNVGCLVGGLALGWFVDDRVDTTPVFTLAGLAFGIAVGIWGSWLRIRQFLRS
jgi:putative F0F1-ATPase subunit (Ca2+/Mg2+ transporter)